jgi:hypothetical protein
MTRHPKRALHASIDGSGTIPSVKRRLLNLLAELSLLIGTATWCFIHSPDWQVPVGNHRQWIVAHKGEELDITSYKSFVVWEIPLGTIALLAMVAPTIIVIRWYDNRCKAKKLRIVGLCHRCGYDLRATPDRCPECGTFVKQI